MAATMAERALLAGAEGELAGRPPAVLELSLSDDDPLVPPGPPAKRLRSFSAAEGAAATAAPPQRAAPRRRRQVFAPSSDEDDEPPRAAAAGSHASPAVASSAAIASTAAGARPPPGLEQLLAMGFPEDAARGALASAGGDVAAAAEALTEPAVVAVEQAAPKAPAASGARSESPLMQLLAMGFQRAAAADALAAACGDLAAAAEALAGGAAAGKAPAAPSSPPRPVEAAAAAAPAERSALARLSHRAKAAVVKALAGEGPTGSGAVERSIKRGRVALRRNLWEGAEEERLEELSPAYKRLKGYQRAGVRWLLGLARAGFGGILADEMGLGKTAQTLTFLDLLAKLEGSGRKDEDGFVTPTLVVVPPTLFATWEGEAAQWCPHFRVFRYHSSSQTERWELADEFLHDHHGRCELVLTTPHALHRKEDRIKLFNRVSFNCLICDEAHSLKNAAAHKFRDVQRAVRTRRRLLLTGTPVQNSLRELGNLLSLLLAVPPQESSSHGGPPELRRCTQKALNELEDLVERGVLRTLQVRAAPLILRRLKRDVIKELPAKTGNTVRCRLTAEQQAQYDRELTGARKANLKDARTRQDFVKGLFHRLRRICNHPLLGQTRFEDSDYARLVAALRQIRPDFERATLQKAMDEVRSWSDFDVIQAVKDMGLSEKLGGGRFEASDQELVEGSAKVKELINLLTSQREAQRKTLVFSQFTQYLDVVCEALDRVGLVYARLDGKVNIQNRPELVRQFQQEGSGIDVFLLSTKAGGTGLNLTAADQVVLLDLSFNPQDNRQAEDRAHRLGQARPVTVHYLVSAGTIEETVLKANLKKMVLDYKFGGQQILLGGQGCQPAPAPEGEEDEDEEEEEEEGQGKQAVDPKCLEREVLAELESVCRA